MTRSMTNIVPVQTGQRIRLAVSGRSVPGAVPSRLAAAGEGGLPSSVGEQSEVANADQPFGQDVKKKSAQELIC